MSGLEPDMAARALQRHKYEDAAILLPVLGILLLISPILNTFVEIGPIFGIPAPIFYIFCVWAGLIILSFRLARLLTRSDEKG